MIILPIIIVTILIACIAYFIKKKRHSPEAKGKRGENMVAQILGETIIGEQYVVNDLLFEPESGKSCQIDHIFINKYGIWVIETKNYSGNIYGEEKQREWTQVLAFGNTKNKLYNPIKQNATHIYYLSRYLNVKNIFHNIVVFLSGADISNVTADNVYSISGLSAIKSKKTDIDLTIEEMESFYNKLMELKSSTSISKEDHIENIHKMQSAIRQGICPRCNGKLVLRNGQNGQFYGCSNYPNCKFTKNIE